TARSASPSIVAAERSAIGWVVAIRVDHAVNEKGPAFAGPFSLLRRTLCLGRRLAAPGGAAACGLAAALGGSLPARCTPRRLAARALPRGALASGGLPPRGLAGRALASRALAGRALAGRALPARAGALLASRALPRRGLAARAAASRALPASRGLLPPGVAPCGLGPLHA